jgi:hypothetical protein
VCGVSREKRKHFILNDKRRKKINGRGSRLKLSKFHSDPDPFTKSSKKMHLKIHRVNAVQIQSLFDSERIISGRLFSIPLSSDSVIRELKLHFYEFMGKINSVLKNTYISLEEQIKYQDLFNVVESIKL